MARFAAAGARDKLRRFKEFYDGAASWDRVERIIARIEADLGLDGMRVLGLHFGGVARGQNWVMRWPSCEQLAEFSARFAA